MAVNPDNVKIYAEEWAIRLQEELDEPVKWKEIMKVVFTNSRVIHNPYLTDATVQTGERGTPYTYQAITETDESTTINTYSVLPQVIDRADLAQSDYSRQMELATRQAILLNENIESTIYADHPNTTNFDNSDIGGSAGSITVSLTNVDNIIRNVKKVFRVQSGETMFNRYGGFIVWRPADLEVLENFMQANGFVTSDAALRGDVTELGFNYMGLTHYSSNLLVAEHLLAGVKNVYQIGILKDTYGQVMVDEKDPGEISGVSIVSRVDYAVIAWNKTKPLILDIEVT